MPRQRGNSGGTGEGFGDDTISGGAGWTDVIHLEASDGSLGTYGTDWTVALTEGEATISDEGYLELTADSDGAINLADGATIGFEDIERIQF